MGEKFPTERYQHNGEFTDPAWTAFSEAQLPLSKINLEHENSSESDMLIHKLKGMSYLLKSSAPIYQGVRVLYQEALDANNTIIKKEYHGETVEPEELAVVASLLLAVEEKIKKIEAVKNIPILVDMAEADFNKLRIEINTLSDDEKAPLTRLDGLIDKPIGLDEVESYNGKDTYFTKILPWISAAFFEAGLKNELEIFEAKNLSRFESVTDANLMVIIFNKIIKEAYGEVVKGMFENRNSKVTFKSEEPVSILNDSKVTPGADSTPFRLTESMRIDTKYDPLPEENITDQVAPVAAIAEIPTELTAPENVPKEEGQNGLDLYSLTKGKVESKTENPEDVSNFQEKFRNLLDKESFTPSDYVEFVNELHTAVRSRYDEVIASAEKNLQRYSSTYTPSVTEKVALQFLSSLRARYEPMQAKESETGILRAKVISSPDNPDSHTNADDVRKFTEEYFETMKKVLSGITKLEGLIATSITETKPLMSETYQLQFETLRVSGNQVLSTLPENHELYEPFKNLIESRLRDVIANISDTANGNVYFISNYTDISIVRDKIKAAVSYLKTEQEFSDYKTRAQARLAKIKTKLTLQRTDSTESQTLTQEIVEKVEQVNLDLATPITLGSQNNLAFAVASSVEASVKDIKDLETKIKVGLAEVEKKLVLLGQLDPAKESTSRALIEDASVVTPENFSIPKILEVASASNRLRPESVTNRERVKKLLSYFTLTKISQAAVLAAAVAWPTPTGTDSQAGSFPVMTTAPFVGVSSLAEVSTAFSTTEISDYLRSVTTVKPAEASSVDMVAQPSINSYQPSNLQSPRTASEKDGVFVSVANQAIPVNAMPIPRQSESEPSDAQPFIEDVPVYQSAENSKTEDVKHTITKGDIFWNIAEGETAVGMLPVMQEINSKLHQKMIDIARKEINKNPELRRLIGGFDETKAIPANYLIIGKSMNITELDRLMRKIAIDRGYL